MKLDKGLIRTAMENEKARNTLKYSMQMFQSIHVQMVAEGIEAESMVKEQVKLGCNYL